MFSLIELLWEPWVTVQTWPCQRTTPYTTSLENGTKIASIEKPSKGYESLEGINSKLLRNMGFAKRYNEKDLKKLQANSVKMMSAHTATIKILMEHKMLKPKMPKSPN